jgi:uncharacterized protein YfaS (alpha-2-macroglobulin family)
LIASCGGKTSTTPGATPLGAASPLTDQVLQQTKDLPPGLDLHVSSGREGVPAFDHAKLAPATKLGDADVQALLARAQPLQSDADDQQAFALRPRSAPPPRAGATIHASFPPPPGASLPAAPTVDTSRELRVLRSMPEGPVPLAPELTVTFSQPMVAVTSQEDAATTTPVRLTPQPKGKWRWIGTRTILFDPDPRFPQATKYQVEIPAGTHSATGGVLKDAVHFTFETPPPSLVASYPSGGGSQHLDVPMFAVFDQKIDRQAVLAHTRVTAAGRPADLELLDDAAIAKDKKLAAQVDATKKNQQDGRWLAFHARAPFPKDARIEVAFDAGTPSAEGPTTTDKPQRFGFQTYPPLRVDQSECGWNGECRPGTPFRITFNNMLDADKFDESQISVSPAISGMKISQTGEIVSLVGLTEAHTTYHVSISRDLRDEFDQTLGSDAQLSFSVGSAQPTFFGPNGLIVADPAATKPTLDFFTINYEQLKVQLYQVQPADYDAYTTWIRNLWNHDHPPRPPGHKVFDALVPTSAGADKLVETAVKLQPALAHPGLGHVVAIVEPYPWKENYDPPRMIAWVQATKLAVDAHVDSDSLVAYASDLQTGKPAAGVELEIRPFGIRSKTDDHGLATLPLRAATGVKGGHYLVARRGDDVAFVIDQGGMWSEYGSWSKHSADAPRLAWYVIDDRKLYKPGEEVALKGWLRMVDSRKHGDVNGLHGEVTGIDYKVYDSRGKQLATGSVGVNAVGGFDTKFTLPKTPNLGYGHVDLETRGTRHENYSHSFQIEEFRRPEFEVSTRASQGPFLVGSSADVTVNAKYFAGGPLPGAPVQWYVNAHPTSFTPPNRDDYVFGAWRPWWDTFEVDEDEVRASRRETRDWSLAGKTDATGAHVLHLDFLSLNPALPMALSAHASVTDVNRQSWSASAALIVHPSSLYVGLKSKKPFVDKGTPFELDVIGVDLDGKARPGAKIEVKAARLDWEYKKGKYYEREVDPQTCAVIAAADPVVCRFATPKGGSYQVTATILDREGHPNQTKLQFWVSGGDTPPVREVKQERVQLIPDRKDYAPGTTAELLVQAPFYPAEGVVTWRRSGIVHVEKIALAGPSATLQVPIEDAMTPNLFVQVDLVGEVARTDDHGAPDPKLPKRPAYAVGTIELPVPPRSRTLAVSIKPGAPKVVPGDTARLALEVKDAAGHPVANAEAAVLVVDEAVLALTGYQFPDPMEAFYSLREAGATDAYERSFVVLAKPDAASLQGPRSAGGHGGLVPDTMAAETVTSKAAGEPPPPPPAPPGQPSPRQGGKLAFNGDVDQKPLPAKKANGGGAPSPIAIRSNFNPLASFSPAVKTGPDGRAVVEVKVPDNLTRYRVVAIAVAGERQFGKGEDALTARLPLMVRPSPPRFLNFGDTFRLPVVVQNQTDAPVTVQLAVRATNAAITDGAGRQVTVPANDRVEVQFPAAAELAGTARFQVVGASGTASDAAELALPVWTPATTEAFATYGVIDDGAVKQPVALPGKVVTQFGGLEIETASTNLQSLTDAMLYLVHYPFECAEQRSSRILAIAALRDVLEQFHTKDMPSRAAMDKSVADDLERLSQMQNYDGGFAFWDRGHPSEPYLTVFVVNALAHAKAKGFAVPAGMLERAKPYLQAIESKYPSYYSAEVRHAISAYALYTRKQLGDADLAKGKKLYKEWDAPAKVTMETDGWLLGLFAGDSSAADERKALVRYALNHVSETAGAANFTTSYGDGNYLLLASDRRVDGVMLESLIEEQPSLDLIPKVVTGLLAHRKAGRWLNTQENAFVLEALDLYFQTYEKVTPDFVARAWLGKDYAGDHAFKGRQTDRFEIDIPMKEIAARDKSDLVIQKDGKGRLYYRVGMTYAPASLQLDPADYGFVVQRRYEAVDDPADVVRGKDGAWHVKAGARVRVRVTMLNENRRYHVALVDPMPAGFEAMNPSLAVTGPIPQDPTEQAARGKYWWWFGTWYEHQNMRDERVEAFASLLWEGAHEYSYVARATTPGAFVVPPPKAEEMYMPETFGRGGSDRVIVE